MERMILSAPFGNGLQWEGYTSTLGTFTSMKRAGFWRKLWKVLRTLRPTRAGWVNKLGLPNPGLSNYAADKQHWFFADKIISIYGFNENDWLTLAKQAEALKPMAIELNLSCPNVTRHGIMNLVCDIQETVRFLTVCPYTVIAKLPPVRWMDLAWPLHGMGVSCFHCCNTIPVPGGGLSGKAVKQYSLWAIEELRARYGDTVTLTGGGGVSTMEDVTDYLNAGASHIAVGSACLNPFNWGRLKRIGRELYQEKMPLYSSSTARSHP